MWEKLRDNLGFAIAVASLVLTVAFGLNVDKVFDVSRPYFIVPYGAIMFALGCTAGWWLRDALKTRDAKTKARIERDKADRAERMRLEQEARAAREAAEAEKREHEERLSSLASSFRTFEIETKKLACIAYDDGEFVARTSIDGSFSAWSREVKFITDYETLPGGRFRYTLKPDVQEMIDVYPELIAEVRESMKEGQQG